MEQTVPLEKHLEVLRHIRLGEGLDYETLGKAFVAAMVHAQQQRTHHDRDDVDLREKLVFESSLTYRMSLIMEPPSLGAEQPMTLTCTCLPDNICCIGC